jgi:hypothetical protein
LFTEVAKVAGAWISRAAMTVPEVTTGDHSKGADSGERARLGATKRVFEIAVANELALRSAREVYLPRERVMRSTIWISSVAVAGASTSTVQRPCLPLVVA